MWIDVQNYEEYFQVNAKGQILSKRTGKILKLTKLKNGYLTFASKIGGRNGKNICLRVNILVAKAFVPNPLNLPQVNHKDGNKLNNHYENLEWVTGSENQLHAYKTGLRTATKGIDNPLAKFNQSTIDLIRSMEGQYSYRTLAKMFNVSHVTISNIINKQTYV